MSRIPTWIWVLVVILVVLFLINALHIGNVHFQIGA